MELHETLIKEVVGKTVAYLKNNFVAKDDVNYIKDTNPAADARRNATRDNPQAFVREARMLRAEIANLLEAAAAGADLEDNAIELYEAAERLLDVETALREAATHSEEP